MNEKLRSGGFVRIVRSEVEPDKEPMIEFVASTAAQDRYNDVVDQSWKLDNYRKNPVVLVDHDYQVESVVARGDVRVENGALILKVVQWGSSPRAAQVKADVLSGFLSSVSVGFRPGRSVSRASLDKESPYYAEDYGFVHYDNELLEVSIVAVPANPEALAVRSAPSIDLAALVDQVADKVFRRIQAAKVNAAPATNLPPTLEEWFSNNK